MRHVHKLAFLIAIGCCSFATAQPAAPQNKQAVYDAAQAAFDKDDWTQASQGFAKLLPAEPGRPLSRSEAVIASRYATALFHLERLDEAQGWISRSLQDLGQDDATLVADAWITRGDVERLRYDYPEALKAYRQADALLASSGLSDQLVRARFGHAYVATTYDPSAVTPRLGALLADPAFAKAVPRDTLAQAEDLVARAAMNAGDKPAARHWMEKAVDDSGGLTTERVSIGQVTIRADAGIIARLQRRDDDARRYFTYTGAGHLKDMSWVVDHAGDLPVCGDAADEVRPDDSVVVTFAIGVDGAVVGAIPVYASRPGPLGAIFAKTVSSWRWNPEKLRKVEGFWRATLQLELRCVTRPQPAELGKTTYNELGQWLKQRGLITPAELATLEANQYLKVRSDDARLTQPGGVVLRATAARLPEEPAKIEQLWMEMEKVGAPPSAFATLIKDLAGTRSVKGNGLKESARIRAQTYAEWLPRFRKAFPEDRAVSWIVLNQALALEDSGDFAGAQPLLETLTNRKPAGVPADDVLVHVAQLHQAIGLDRAGKAEAAKAVLERSGLTLDQCSLFDTHPVAESLKVASSAFPEEALRWQFEGFAQEAYDIDDNGGVKNVRTVVSYPPFVFDQATERAVTGFRYVPPRVGGKAVGCQAHRQSVSFRIADYAPARPRA